MAVIYSKSSLVFTVSLCLVALNNFQITGPFLGNSLHFQLANLKYLDLDQKEEQKLKTK